MRRVSLLLLLTGCGFQSGTASMNGGDGGGGGSDGSGSGGFDATPLCPKIVGGMLGFNASACATPTVGSIDISTSVSIDTAPGASNPPGLACAVDSATICVLVAPTITIETGAVLSAHGPRPFALFGHSITIRGTVDVASHIATGVIGAGSLQSSCIPGTLPTLSGGGRGGDAVTLGGVGGGGGGGKGLGGSGGGSFGISVLQGGCGGTRGGDGGVGGGTDEGKASGGAGGGAVWIVADTAEIVVDRGAVINASGAGGVGAATEMHGGAGGGAGGLIVLQSPSLRVDGTAMIFANGGGGGGGAGLNSTLANYMAGRAGGEATVASAGGSGGAGAVNGSSLVGNAGMPGDGGDGFPGALLAGQNGGADGRGGGGGGGGAGAIRVVSRAGTNIDGNNVSPPAVYLQ